MANDKDFSELFQKFKSIKDSYAGGTLKYLHPKTVENFVYHATAFNIQLQDQIYLTLAAYFDRVDSSRLDNIAEAVKNYNGYLGPLSRLYSVNKGFHLAFRPWFFIAFAIILFLISWLFNAPLSAGIPGIGIIILFFIRQLYFEKKKKTYGFLY